MSSSSSSSDEDAYDSGYDSDDVSDSEHNSRVQRKNNLKHRPKPFRLRGIRKKTRSIDDGQGEDQHTGLSPRLTRMDLVLPGQQQRLCNDQVFFLEDGIETFSVDGDPRAAGVREIYRELDRRLEKAAVNVGLSLFDPAVANLKKQLALRAAELEAGISKSFSGLELATYRDAIYRLICWIQGASEADLREVMEGHAKNFTIKDWPISSAPNQEMQYPTLTEI